MNYKTLIHERVALCNQGKNPTAICKLKSGWLVLGDDQRLRGYSLLLSDPTVETINHLSFDKQMEFLSDMLIIGNSLMEVVSPHIINYSILGNTDRALHCHIHPRYNEEKEEQKKTVPFIYHILKFPIIKFEFEKDKELIGKIRKAIEKKTKIYD
jgi:diadenosine tetraphosphate (Ap4A) HIT family hydrolase